MDSFSDSRAYYALLAAGLGLPTYFIFQALHNLLWHPLAGFPGPKLGAITRFYKAYIDGSPSKSFVHSLKEFHAKYGITIPINIQRINILKTYQATSSASAPTNSTSPTRRPTSTSTTRATAGTRRKRCTTASARTARRLGS